MFNAEEERLVLLTTHPPNMAGEAKTANVWHSLSSALDTIESPESRSPPCKVRAVTEPVFQTRNRRDKRG